MHSNRPAFAALAFLVALWTSSCAVPLGPGYTIEKQSVIVHFVSLPQLRIEVEANYDLQNSGNQPLSLIEIHLPSPLRYRVTQSLAEWNGSIVPLELPEDAGASDRTHVLRFPAAWELRSRSHLRVSFEIEPAAAGDAKLNIAADAFYLPAEGWNPELLPAGGLFGTGGVPPKQWGLSAQVPQDFLVHASGQEGKTLPRNGEKTVIFFQLPPDHYPFLLAGHYTESRFDAGRQTIRLWTRTAQDAAVLRHTRDALARALNAYDAFFGERRKDPRAIWIMECPVADTCAPQLSPDMTRLFAPPSPSGAAEVASLDSVLVNISNSAADISVAAGPSLAASWLGYGRNPGFWDQDPPLSALPAFAAAIGREALEGPAVRLEIIRHALVASPLVPAAKHRYESSPSREKSLLFFYALQDQYGKQAFARAMTHMVQARRGRGFGLSDLIAAVEQETHQNVAEFVRLWLKHPGIPAEFRARYVDLAALVGPEKNREALASSKETLP